MAGTRIRWDRVGRWALICVFALILYLSVLGLGTFWSVVWLQRRLVFWYKTTRSREGQVG